MNIPRGKLAQWLTPKSRYLSVRLGGRRIRIPWLALVTGLRVPVWDLWDAVSRKIDIWKWLSTKSEYAYLFKICFPVGIILSQSSGQTPFLSPQRVLCEVIPTLTELLDTITSVRTWASPGWPCTSRLLLSLQHIYNTWWTFSSLRNRVNLGKSQLRQSLHMYWAKEFVGIRAAWATGYVA